MSAASISQQTQPIAANAILSLIRAKFGKMRVVARPGSGATMRVFKSSNFVANSRVQIHGFKSVSILL